MCSAGHHISCPSSKGQIYVNMFVVRAGWCTQLTNEHCEVYLFINAEVFTSTTNLIQPIWALCENINTYVHI